MDQTHLHLLTNHVSMFALVFGALILVLGFMRKSEELKLGAAVLFVAGSIAFWPAFLTGEEAEHKVEEIAGVSHDDIEEHEEAAKWGRPFIIILGLVSAFGLFKFSKIKAIPKAISLTMLVLSLFTFTILARTAYLGGYIRHSEIHQGAAAGAADDSGKADDADNQ
ncbi:MAG TPA: hypothetical protein VFH43_06115 [Candidatus Kapabacteria bacterium]|nr:hypothetical protein [Candidatus Kapabacteria bacterium]